MGEKKNSLKVTQKQWGKRGDNKYGVRNEDGTTNKGNRNIQLLHNMHTDSTNNILAQKRPENGKVSQKEELRKPTKPLIALS